MSLSELGLYRNTEWKEEKVNGSVVSIPVDWDVKKLKGNVVIKSGKANAEDNEENGIYPLFDRSVSIKKSNKFLFDNEALIFPGEGQNFRPRYISGKYNLHQRAYSLSNFIDNIHFMKYKLNSLNEVLRRNAVGSTVPSLRMNTFENLDILTPEIEEQTRIASILTKQEDLIEHTKEKISKLKKQRKYFQQELLSGRLRIRLTQKATGEALSLGLLEQILLNAENEPMVYGEDKVEDVKIDIVDGKQEEFENWLNIDFDSKIEFYKNLSWKEVKINGRIFEIPIDWKVEKLSDNLIGVVGFTPSTAIDNNYIGNVKWINISDLQDIIVENKKTINISTISNKKQMLSKNSLLFSFKLSIGRVGFTKFDNMVTNEAIMGFDYKTNKNVNLKYFYYILPIYSILNAGRNAFGSPLMNQKTLNNSKLILTKNILEQTLIATLLTKSDNLIEKEEQNLKKEEKRFKFFQQELLSGRIRTR